MSKYILAIDQGTTSCRAILYDMNYKISAAFQMEFSQFYPHEGWVEHNPIEIWETQLECCKKVIASANIHSKDILTIGITNQRETIVAWNKETGVPIYNAIVWQDRRTAANCIIDETKIGTFNRSKTGLNIDAYFSAPKIRWIIENIPEAKELIKREKLCISTIDSWLLWKLTCGMVFATDASNASRTNIYNIRELGWDQELLDYYQISKSILPDVFPSMHHFGNTDISIFGEEIAISGIAGDQQAALYGHQCFEKGMMKNTFGTGCFLLQNIGNEFKLSDNNLITTIAWQDDEELIYAIEGSVFNAGSALKWIKENLNLIKDYQEIDEICNSVEHTDNDYIVPAFTGLGAPYWDMHARGMIIGLNRNTQKSHIVRATIESLAFQTKDIIQTIELDSGTKVKELRIDGGVSESLFLLQSLSDILQIPIIRTESKECTALGVAKMAAKSMGYTIKTASTSALKYYTPQMNKEKSLENYSKWKNAIERCKNWV